MWFGTEDGLNKYDGYDFEIYKNDPENPNSFCHTYVKAIYEDKSGVLWIGTYGGGLDKFDREKEQFIHYQADPNDSNSLSNNFVSSIYEDRSGVLWIGTEDGLNRLVPNESDGSPPTFIQYKHDTNNPNSLSNSRVASIYEDKSGVFWIGTYGGGLNKLVLSESDGSPPTFIHYKYEPNDPNSLSNNFVSSICEDRSGVLWIGTEDGLNRLVPNESEGSLPTFIHYKHDTNNPNSLSNSRVTSFYEDKSGVFWIGTQVGLNKLVLSESEGSPLTFIHYKHDPNDSKSLSANEVYSIYEDRAGVLWIGTDIGLNKHDQEKKLFIHYQNKPNDPNSLSNNHVYSIYEDKSGVFWIGTYSGGLNKLVPSESDGSPPTFILYRADPNNPNSLSSDFVRTIYEDKSGVLWVGTADGLNKLVPSECEGSPPTFIHYKADPDDPDSLSHNYVRSIYEDKSGVLWIGIEDGLNKFDRDKEQFIHYKADPNDPNSLSSNFVYSIIEDQLSILWVGTINGLNKLVRSANEASPPTFIHYKADPDNPNSLSNSEVLAIYEDRSGVLWIGTPSGLNKFDRAKEIFTYYTEKDGLPNDLIYSILEDNKGNLWLSTNKGISKFDPRTEKFKNYDVEDGLQSNEFNLGAHHKNRDGEMFFGGINGFNSFYPDRIRDNPYVPIIVITDFQIFNQSVLIGEAADGRSILTKSITETEEIKLSYKDRSFSFEFAALHYVSPDKNKYAYMMEGFEQEWNEVGIRHFATYTNLSPGDYIFRVKGSNNDGVWNEEGVSLKIKITSPFWQTWWFRGSGVIAFLLLMFSVYQVRTHNIRERSKQFEMQVEERTAELRSIATELEISNKELKATTEKLEVVNKQLKDFAYIVSHDLKAPLRAVSQLATWISQDHASAFDKGGKEQMDLLIGRVKRMSSLIDGILEYSRIGQLKEKEEEVDLNNVIKEVIEALAPPKNIHVTIEDKLPVILAETVRIEQVFQNLISNAIKYMDKPKGKIRIGCVDEGTHWRISIADNGPGIDNKYHDKIFQIFQTLESRDKRESTGVGLALVKKIVELYGGKIWVESKTGEGSTFFFTLRKIK